MTWSFGINPQKSFAEIQMRLSAALKSVSVPLDREPPNEDLMLLVWNAYRCAKNPGDKKTLSEMNLMCTLWDKKCDCCFATNLTSVTVPSHTAVWLLVNNTVSDRLGSICPSHLLSSNLLTQHYLVADEAPLNLNVLIYDCIWQMIMMTLMTLVHCLINSTSNILSPVWRLLEFNK